MSLAVTAYSVDAALPGVAGSGDPAVVDRLLDEHADAFADDLTELAEFVEDDDEDLAEDEFFAGVADDPAAVLRRALEHLVLGPAAVPPVADGSFAADVIIDVYRVLCEIHGVPLEGMSWSPTTAALVFDTAEELRLAGIPATDLDLGALVMGRTWLPLPVPVGNAVGANGVPRDRLSAQVELLTPVVPGLADAPREAMEQYLAWLLTCRDHDRDLVITHC